MLDAAGNRLAPVDVVLQTDGRNPAAKHEILEVYVRHGVALPDTPTMALHRGRIDLLEAHLERDLPGFQSRRIEGGNYILASWCAPHGQPQALAEILQAMDPDIVDVNPTVLGVIGD